MPPTSRNPAAGNGRAPGNCVLATTLNASQVAQPTFRRQAPTAQRRALNALRFCLRHSALLDTRDARTLERLAWMGRNPNLPLGMHQHSWRPSLTELELEQLSSILAKIERERRKPLEPSFAAKAVPADTERAAPEHQHPPKRKNTMADFSAAFGGKYLNASHVTMPFVGTVESVELEDVDGNGKSKPVLRFEGRDRGVVLNSTRYDMVSQLAGSRDTDNWIGIKIRVARGKTRFGGKAVDCVEFGPPAEKTAADIDHGIPGWN